MSKFFNLFKIAELRNKVLAVAGLLIVFRLLASIPIPGIDAIKLKEFFASSQLLGFLNIFSGGALSRLSILMLGVGPYITSTIIMQLLTLVFPSLKQMYYEEGPVGRAKFNRWSRLITVPLAALQGYGFLNLLASRGVLGQLSFANTIINVIIVTAGTMILMWLGELISEFKIGNGISLIIFAGIVSRIPDVLTQALASYDPTVIPTYLAFAMLSIVIIAAVVFVTQGERKIPISYAKRVRGNKVYGGVSSYLPMKVNQAGVIPIIFAISILLFPQFVAQISSIISPELSAKLTGWVTLFFNNQIAYSIVYFLLVVMFTYFYTSITFEPKEISKNLQRSGGFVPGIRPGEPTSDFLAQLSNRITLFGSLFLGFVAVLPNVTQLLTGIATLTIGGTALLIVVSVALEIMNQIESQLVIREYDGF